MRHPETIPEAELHSLMQETVEQDYYETPKIVEPVESVDLGEVLRAFISTDSSAPRMWVGA